MRQYVVVRKENNGFDLEGNRVLPFFGASLEQRSDRGTVLSNPHFRTLHPGQNIELLAQYLTERGYTNASFEYRDISTDEQNRLQNALNGKN
ncbi:MAG: hypothetical protein AABX23_01010 [Nanoarchaeota archaeon]